MIEPDIREHDMIKIRPRFTNKLTTGNTYFKKTERNLFWKKKSPINIIFRKNKRDNITKHKIIILKDTMKKAQPIGKCFGN